MEKQCKRCRKTFYVKPSAYDKKYYCSKECEYDDYKTRLLGSNNPNFRDAGLHICAYCSKEYRNYNKTSKYCSQECYRLANLGALIARNKAGKKYKKCKLCGVQIKNSHVYCNVHNPNIKIIKYCEICGSVLDKQKKRFCSECRSNGLHKKQVISICDMCGKIIYKYKRKYCDECLHIFFQERCMTHRRKDQNHNDIVSALLDIGCSVQDLSAVGRGVPDIIVGYKDNNFLIEIKNRKSKGRLNNLQKKWFEEWNGGHAGVAYTVEDAYEIIGYRPDAM